MTKPKRFFNLKTIFLVATLVILMACYFAARNVMVWDVELGMTRTEVVKVLGESHEFDFPLPVDTLAWKRTLFSDDIYYRITLVEFDNEDKAVSIKVWNNLFHHSFTQSRSNVPFRK